MVRRILWRARGLVDTLLLSYQWRCRRKTGWVEQELKATLWNDYLEYITGVSTPDQAASWELAVALLSLLSTGLFSRCLDLGSGFTSYALRYWRARLGERWRVVSVDDDVTWLQKTRTFIDQKGLRADECYSENQFLQLADGPVFDLIVYDYSRFDHRTEFLPTLSRLLQGGSVLIFDDYHKRPTTWKYRHALDTWCLENRIRLVILKPLTLDKWGRYSVMGYLPGSDSFRKILGCI